MSLPEGLVPVLAVCAGLARRAREQAGAAAVLAARWKR